MIEKINIIVLSAIYRYLMSLSNFTNRRKTSTDNSGTRAVGKLLCKLAADHRGYTTFWCIHDALVFEYGTMVVYIA